MRIFGHRGDSKKFGDNNMESYKKAIECGSDGIEMDVCITRDSVLIMAHNSVEKSTGVPTYERDYDRSRDLTLKEVLTEFSRYPIEFIIDIKDPRYQSGICKEIYNMCMMHECLDKCIIGSFNESHLRDLYKIEESTNTTIKKAFITSNLNEDMFRSVINKFRLTHLILYKFQLNSDLVHESRQRGVRVYVYTCNTHGLYDYVSSMGCDGLITDTPGKFTSIDRGNVY